MKEPKGISRMFGRIARRYDRLNRIMSLGMDGRWRQQAAASAKPDASLALDIGTGTGDLALELTKRGARQIVGADFSLEMLAAARAKLAAKDVLNASWTLADALHLPFPDGTFDCVTNAFVLRNLADLRSGLAEMARVLQPGGRLVCLDMTQPPPGIVGTLYKLYFYRLLPPIAGVLSGDRAAYRYLPNSLVGFPDSAALAELLAEIGLVEVEVRKVGGGTVAIHTAVKPPARGPT
ncbi:MAG: bifunctional demethylmenaquinone methyltransferase/2-methoxy-6-polyprenyl-1,4-benzoquinol methylase UbiE [Chloroflexi bacterium]|nr:bifunctional demethylmenaquinone methyltransferase/2-methoxy-6-polyprenyl-1,4-benzoquinol methylase UbiE [Chloroflexota bacterium]